MANDDRIASINLVNYRGHTNTTIPLEPFTLLVGDNGTGKSSALEAVHLLGQALRERSAQVFSEKRKLGLLQRSGAQDPMAIRLSLEDSNWWVQLKRRGASADPGDLHWDYRNGERAAPYSSALNEHGPQARLRIAETAVYLQLQAQKLAAPSASGDIEPRIQPDGSGLATVLKELKLKDAESFKALEQSVVKVVPNFASISFERVQEEGRRSITVEGRPFEIPEPRIADGLRLQFKDTEPLPAHCASEGTLLALGLLAVFYLPRHPRLILLDDIERGLHPRAQAQLVETLRAALKERPGTQIIATSHSPYLVDSFKPEEVVVLSRSPEGIVARRLADHPDTKLIEALTAGEFLAASGSDWFGL